MKMYRSATSARTYIEAKDEEVTRAGIIVWLGSSEYWNRVYLHAGSHKLCIKVAPHTYQPLDEFNIRKTEIDLFTNNS